MENTTEALDPVELAIHRAHECAVDVLEAVLLCKTPSRAMQIREQLSSVIRALEAVENAALDKADKLMEVL